MKSIWIGAAVGALAGLGLAATAQAAPTGVSRAATVVGDTAPQVTEVGRRHRHYRHRHRHHYHHHHHRPRYRYYYGSPYWYGPRRYYRPYYGYYGHRHYRRPGFSIWF